MSSDRVNYYEYLQSDAWRAKRQARLIVAGYRCELCNISYRLHVHHRTYDRLGNEDVGDLLALCEKCHEQFHDRIPEFMQDNYWDVYALRIAGLIVKDRK